MRYTAMAVVVGTLAAAFGALTMAVPAGAGPNATTACEAHACGTVGAFCLDDALNDLLTGTAPCVSMKATAVAGKCTGPMPEKLNDTVLAGRAASCTPNDRGNPDVAVDVYRDDFAAHAGEQVTLTLGTAPNAFVVKTSKPVPSSRSSNVSDAGLAETSHPKAEEANQGDGGPKLLVPIDVPPRNCTQGGGVIPDIEWTPRNGRTTASCDDTTASGTPRSHLGYYEAACRRGETPSDMRTTTDDCSGPLGKAKNGDHEKVFVVDEDLQPRGGSPGFVTDADVIVVRFLVRRALACRVHATSDATNKYAPSTFVVGGQGGIAPLPSGRFVFTGAPGGVKKLYSCDEELLSLSASQTPDQPAQYTTSGNEYVTVDYRFGPFTSDSVSFHLYRHDRMLSQNDMESALTVPNHARYNGWFDMTLGANFLFAHEGSAYTYPQSGDAMTRIGSNDRLVNYDIAILVKVFATCFTRETLFEAVDLGARPVCLGLGAGLSLAHPLHTFYPFGLNLTLNRFFSIHGMISLNRFDGLAPGYSPGAIYSGDTSNLPSKDRYVLGAGLAFGLDPSLFAVLLKGLVTGGK